MLDSFPSETTQDSRSTGKCRAQMKQWEPWRTNLLCQGNELNALTSFFHLHLSRSQVKSWMSFNLQTSVRAGWEKACPEREVLLLSPSSRSRVQPAAHLLASHAGTSASAVPTARENVLGSFCFLACVKTSKPANPCAHSRLGVCQIGQLYLSTAAGFAAPARNWTDSFYAVK